MNTGIRCVARDIAGETMQRAIIPTEAEAWDYASQLLFREEKIKRIIFYDCWFTFLNAVSRPGYQKDEDEIISEQDKQALLILRELS